MLRTRIVLAVAVVFSLFAGLLQPVSPVVAATPHAVGFVSGQWRVVVHQVAVVDADAALGLAKSATGDPWIVAVLDVTNTGTSQANLVLGEFAVSTANADGAGSLDAAATMAATKKISGATLDPAGAMPLTEDETQRVVLVLAADGDVDVDGLVLGHGSERIDLDAASVDSVNVSTLPALQIWSVSQQVVDGQNLAAVQLPPADGCYGAETAQAIANYTGGSVWVEPQGELTWYWDATAGHLVPLQQILVENGFAGVNVAPAGTFTNWLHSKAAAADAAGTGLWQVCKDSKGTWINPPTPAPPTAEEVRADYVWVDVRDLAIRPYTFEGEKIALEGEVFTIQAEEGFTGMQIWVNSPTGDREPVVVIYPDDLVGVYEGTWITVYGVGAGTFEGTNGFGATITQPMVRADIVDY